MFSQGNTIFKVIVVVLCAALVAGTAYMGAMVYTKINTQSETYGKIEQHNVYEDFDKFSYDLSKAKFYINEDKNGYKLTQEYAVETEFDGLNNEYNVLINNSPCDNEKTAAGHITANYTKEFYAIDGEIIKTVKLAIDVKYYLSKIVVTIETICDAQSYGLLLEYIQFNGLNLRIIEKQYTHEDTMIVKEYAVYWLNYDNSILQLDYYNKGDQIVIPADPQRDGYIFTGWSPKVNNVVNANVSYVATYKEQHMLISTPTTVNLDILSSNTGNQSVVLYLRDFHTRDYDIDMPLELSFDILHGDTVNSQKLIFDNKTNLVEYALRINYAALVVQIIPILDGSTFIGCQIFIEAQSYPSDNYDNYNAEVQHIADNYTIRFNYFKSI